MTYPKFSFNEYPKELNILPLYDITKPIHGVEIQIIDNILWIHVDGQIVLRICQIPKLIKHIKEENTN